MTGFFMLSGYAMILGYGRIEFSTWNDYKTFYLKRFITIYPLYIVSGSIFVLMMIAAGKQTVIDNLLLLPIEVLGIQAIFPGSLFAYAHNSGTWFVSCIIFCYLLYPMILHATKNIKDRTRIISIVCTLGLLVYLPFISSYFNEGGLYTNPFARLIEFVLGVQLAFIKSTNKNFLKSVSLIVCSLLLIVCTSLFNDMKSLFVAPFFAIIMWLCGNIHTSNKDYKRIRYISSLTYSFFLVQFFVWNPAKFILLHVGKMQNEILIAVTFLLCSILSILMYELIDKSIQKYLKSKLLN